VREVCEQCGSIDQARVIGHVNVVLIGAHILGTVDPDSCEDTPRDQPAPPPGTPACGCTTAGWRTEPRDTPELS
jgi:hypothetical protein